MPSLDQERRRLTDEMRRESEAAIDAAKNNRARMDALLRALVNERIACNYMLDLLEKCDRLIAVFDARVATLREIAENAGVEFDDPPELTRH